MLDKQTFHTPTAATPLNGGHTSFFKPSRTERFLFGLRHITPIAEWLRGLLSTLAFPSRMLVGSNNYPTYLNCLLDLGIGTGTAVLTGIVRCSYPKLKGEDEVPKSAFTALAFFEAVTNSLLMMASYNIAPFLVTSSSNPNNMGHDSTPMYSAMAWISALTITLLIPFLRPAILSEIGKYFYERSESMTKTESEITQLLMEGYNSIKILDDYPDDVRVLEETGKQIIVIQKGEKAGLWAYDGQTLVRKVSINDFHMDAEKIESIYEYCSERSPGVPATA